MQRADAAHSSAQGSTGPRLVCFDLDGTLVRGTSVSLHLAARLDRLRAVEQLEAAYQRSEVTAAELADATAGWYRGLSRREVWTTLAEIPTIGGIGQALEMLRQRRVRLLLATCTWRFAAEYFQARYGFDAVCGTKMKESGRTLSGVVSEYMDGPTKAGFLVDFCAREGIALEDCVAIGNSRSDVPMFTVAGRSIALNATPEARRAARVSIETEDLCNVVPLLLQENPGCRGSGRSDAEARSPIWLPAAAGF
jgi:phosphoserine phosphatase